MSRKSDTASRLPIPPPAAGLSQRRVIVALDADRVKEHETWQKTVEQLRRAGLTVVKELPVIGIVAGSVPDARLADLKRVTHVLAVEDDVRRSASR